MKSILDQLLLLFSLFFEDDFDAEKSFFLLIYSFACYRCGAWVNIKIIPLDVPSSVSCSFSTVSKIIKYLFDRYNNLILKRPFKKWEQANHVKRQVLRNLYEVVLMLETSLVYRYSL